MRKSAGYKEQILQGFKTVGYLLLGYFTIVLLLVGLVPLSGRDPGRFGVWGDLLALPIALPILYFTAHRWSRWLGGFFGLSGVISSLAMLSSGHLLNSPDKPVTRIEASLCLVSSVLLIFFTYPLAASRRSMKVPDRLCLVGAVVAVGLGVSVQKPSATWVWMGVSQLLFCVVWFRYRISRRKHSHRDPHRSEAHAPEIQDGVRPSESLQ